MVYVEGLRICIKIYIYTYNIYVLKQLYKKLHRHNLIVTNADKGKMVVITDNDMCQQKINTFFRENHFFLLPQDPTSIYHKQIQQTLSLKKNLIEKSKIKYLSQISLTPQPHITPHS